MPTLYCEEIGKPTGGGFQQQQDPPNTSTCKLIKEDEIVSTSMLFSHSGEPASVELPLYERSYEERLKNYNDVRHRIFSKNSAKPSKHILR